MVDRSALRRAYRPDENVIVKQRLAEAELTPPQSKEAAAIARSLSKSVRSHKPTGIDAFMAAYDLGSDEGIALMCLAEALLRIPDAETADDLIADKLSGPNWADKLGESSSPFVNAATFSLLLTGKVLDSAKDSTEGWTAALGRAVGRLGEPVIRAAVSQAMKILGKQFVFGRAIDEAMKRAAPERRQGLSHSFDMLGEAAKTHADAVRYAKAYSSALDRIAKEAKDGFRKSPGISVKLSALHPRYEWSHIEEAKAAMLPVLRDLALKASRADVHFTIDAEEADRLEPSLDIIEALAADDELFVNGWGGFGLAIQAYQKRAVPLCDWAAELARKHNRRFMVRLVKGAYWDTEVKAAQVAGLDDYPVYTRKIATDVSYIACAKRLLAASDVIYPAFATHNANTIGVIKSLGGSGEFEFQRLHGMGEGLYEELAKLEDGIGEVRTPVRVYAPVGSHEDLLAYLVRRLLENGANSSFVNRIADEQVSLDDLVRDPVAELLALEPKRNPGIVLPAGLFGAQRRNSAGVDLSDPLVREPLLERLKALETRSWTAKPGLGKGEARAIVSPHDHRITVGTTFEATAADVDRMVRAASAAQIAWDSLGGEKRALLLERAAVHGGTVHGAVDVPGVGGGRGLHEVHREVVRIAERVVHRTYRVRIVEGVGVSRVEGRLGRYRFARVEVELGLDAGGGLRRHPGGRDLDRGRRAAADAAAGVDAVTRQAQARGVDDVAFLVLGELAIARVHDFTAGAGQAIEAVAVEDGDVERAAAGLRHALREVLHHARH